MSICELRMASRVLKRLPRKPEPEGLLRLEQQLAEHMVAVDIIDALSDTEHWAELESLLRSHFGDWSSSPLVIWRSE